MYKIINLHYWFNNKGFTNEDDLEKGELSLSFSSLPQKLINFNKNIIYKGIPFKFSQNNSGDNVEMTGQRIYFGETWDIQKIHVLGTSNNGSFCEEVHIYNDFKPLASKSICFSDFIQPFPQFDEEIVIKFPYTHTQNGINDNFSPIIWYTSIDFDKPIQANNLLFEDNPSMHIFCMTIEVKINE
ncbi:hypothetical protein [Oceanobacillus profundus]|uniref:Uncharacterized protein n=1 Tax=Oceanobacillus profundus TaxID=372463 RepID=A0A417YI35_9BACI|nr:hypothetical protein [Oceanobacillus profundus]RHW32545.1 hypothetical protein D1B32_09445 [Oceanobacillus profundus]